VHQKHTLSHVVISVSTINNNRLKRARRKTCQFAKCIYYISIDQYSCCYIRMMIDINKMGFMPWKLQFRGTNENKTQQQLGDMFQATTFVSKAHISQKSFSTYICLLQSLLLTLLNSYSFYLDHGISYYVW
jgi:hypothetical protein